MMNKWPVLFALILAVAAAAACAQTDEAVPPSGTEDMSQQEEITALKMQIANSKRILANENTQLQNRISELEKAIDELKKANAGLQETNKKLIENPGELRLKTTAAEQAADEARKKAALLEKDCQSLTQEKEALLKRNTEISAENTKLSSACADIPKIEAEYKRLSEKEAAAVRKTRSLTAENGKLREAIAALRRDFAVARHENSRFRAELVPVRKLKARLAVAYEQMGTAYTQLQQYDLAIDAYNKSLIYNFKNPVVHCNLGLLYEHAHNRAQRAIYHLNKYLELNPDAADRSEIIFIIKRLSEVEDGDIVFYN